jgi:hypothetical protein
VLFLAESAACLLLDLFRHLVVGRSGISLARGRFSLSIALCIAARLFVNPRPLRRRDSSTATVLDALSKVVDVSPSDSRVRIRARAAATISPSFDDESILTSLVILSVFTASTVLCARIGGSANCLNRW